MRRKLAPIEFDSWPSTADAFSNAAREADQPTRRAIKALTDVCSAFACASRRFHVSTDRRTLRTAVGLPRGRPRRTSRPTALEGISHKDHRAMPSAGS